MKLFPPPWYIFPSAVDSYTADKNIIWTINFSCIRTRRTCIAIIQTSHLFRHSQ